MRLVSVTSKARIRCIDPSKPILSPMPDAQNWPDELDAAIAAPRNHVLLFENDSVRVLDITVAPGETVPLHTHRWPGILYGLSWSDCVRRDAQGSVMMDSRLSPKLLDGAAVWSPLNAPTHA